MRHLGFIVIAFLAIASGPDPNAHLPFALAPSQTGGDTGNSTGGTTVSNGGAGGATTTSPPATGGATSSNPFAGGGSGGSTKPASGGAAGNSKGGSSGQGGVATGGSTDVSGGSGGATTPVQGGGGGAGTGGRTTPSQGGAGGTPTPSSGALTSYIFPTGDEPCTPAKDFSGGHSDQLGTGAICFRTADEITEWSCSGADDRTVKVNSVATKCGASPPPKKLGSFYYFDFIAGTNSWTSVSWWCSNCGGPGLHPVPSCGKYPAWQSGQTVDPCSDSATTTSVDAGP